MVTRLSVTKWSILIGHTVVFIGKEGRVISIVKILDGDVIQEAADGVPQTQEIPMTSLWTYTKRG